MSITVFAVRHGASASFDALALNEDAVIKRQSRYTPLGKLGSQQAHQTGPRIALLNPDVMLTSPYKRAKQTAEIIATYSPLFPNADENLVETRRIVDGEPIDSEINRRYKAWRGMVIKNQDLNARFHPTDESFGDSILRAVGIKRRLVHEFEHQRLVIVSHSQILSMLITTMIYGDNPSPSIIFNSFNRYFMSHCGITTIKYDVRHGWKIMKFNDTSHLS